MSDKTRVITYLDETKEHKDIKDYQTFLNICYKDFDMGEEEKNTLKVFVFDGEDLIAIENEGDFQDNQDGDCLEYRLKSCLREKKKKEEKEENIENENENEENIENENENEGLMKFNDNNDNDNNNKKDNNDNNNKNDKNDNNISQSQIIKQEIDYSKIKELMNENKEALKKEIFEEFQKILTENSNCSINEKEKEKENNKKITKQIREIKQYLMEKLDKKVEPVENEKSKEIEKEKEEKSKDLKLVKKGVNEIKSFLLSFEEKLNKQNDSVAQLSKVSNDETNLNNKFDNLKTEIENKMNQSLTKINDQYKILNNTLVQISNLIKNQESKKEEIYVKEEKKKILSCHFNDGNYTLQSDYNSLIQMKEFKIELELLNNGTLNWPSNCFLKGYSHNNELSCNYPVNQQELYPDQSIKVKIILFLDKIHNDNYEIDLPLQLIYNNNVKIKQNGFKFKLIVKESKVEKNIFDKGSNVNSNQKRNQNPVVQTETDRGDGNDNDNNNKNKRKKNENYYSRGYFNNQQFGKKNKDDDNKNENFNEGYGNNNNQNNNNQNNNNQNKQNFIVEDDNDDEEDNKDNNNNNNNGNNNNNNRNNKNNNNNKKPNKEQDLLSEDLFQQIKFKLEEDYTLSNIGLSDNDLKEKIRQKFDDNIIKLIKEDTSQAVETLCELCGEDLMSF